MSCHLGSFLLAGPGRPFVAEVVSHLEEPRTERNEQPDHSDGDRQSRTADRAIRAA